MSDITVDITANTRLIAARMFRILPLCIPLSIILMHFIGYGQAMDKTGFVNTLAFLDGVFDVAAFSALLMPIMGLNGVYTANVANGVITTLFIIGYAWIRNGRFPRNMSQLMVIPDDFGVSEDDRMDVSVNKIEDIPGIAELVQGFCLERGADHKRAYAAGLALEEMAGNVILHGFTKDRRKHSVDIRVTYKDEGIILVIRDDCVPFDPGERQKLTDDSSPFSNIGLRMVYRMADDVQYQNILGMNILTIKIKPHTENN